MQLGCGVYEHAVRTSRYLYFWHYENRGGRSVQIKEYIGPARAIASREEAARRCEVYYRRSIEALARMRDGLMASLAARS